MLSSGILNCNEMATKAKRTFNVLLNVVNSNEQHHERTDFSQ